MDNDKINSQKFNELRQLAEQVLKEQAEGVKKTVNEDIQHLIYELQVYQVELEMQNEELRSAQLQLEEARNKYFDLFELAPVGYFTTDKNGIILEVNLTGANLLGVERKYLIKSGLSRYVAIDYQDEFYFHCKRLLETEKEQVCELKLVKPNGTQFYAQLTSMIVRDVEDNPSQFRTAISDITKRKRAEEELQKYSDQLEKMVEERTGELKKVNQELQLEIAERKQSEERIRNYQEQLKFLASELLLSEERERQRISEELHDNTTQNLVLSSIKIKKLIEPVSAIGLDEEIEEICLLIDESIKETRSLTFRLGVPILIELGLGVAVECLLEEFEEKYNISFDFEENGQCEYIDKDICIILFRSFRELLINIIKHAQADRIKVSIFQKEDDNIYLIVEDNGVGFDTSRVNVHLDGKSGFGLFSIREQLKILGGYIEIKSKQGHGTRVTLVVPQKKGSTI